MAIRNGAKIRRYWASPIVLVVVVVLDFFLWLTEMTESVDSSFAVF
jgi:hypothetical protein